MKRVTIQDLTGLKPKEANFVIEYVKDFAARRAAEASGYSPESGQRLLDKDAIAVAIDHVLSRRLETSNIDAEWLLLELVDNHYIARQQGNINASNTALGTIGKHVMVDAMAANKVDLDMTSSKEVAERLQRWRRRTAGLEVPDEPSFL